MITRAVIPTAGVSSRMGTLAGIVPKCLLPVYDKPLLGHILDSIVEAGITDIDIVVSPFGYNAIAGYVYHEYNRVVQIQLLTQAFQSGLASAIRIARRPNEPFVCILGDDFSFPNPIPDIISLFISTNSVAIEGFVYDGSPQSVSNACAIVLGEDDMIVSAIEKPRAPHNYTQRGCGIYAFSDEIFDYIDKAGLYGKSTNISVTEAIDLAAKDSRAIGYRLLNNFNINTPDDLLFASIQLKMYKATC